MIIDEEKAIKNFIDYAKNIGYRVVFSNRRFNNIEKLNCNAGFQFMSIHFSMKWIDLAKENVANFNTMIYFSLGHEICHKKYDITLLKMLFYAISDILEFKTVINFISWCNEIYADRNSVRFVPDDLKNMLLQSFELKMKDKNIYSYDITHPSWDFRKEVINMSSTIEAIEAVAVFLKFQNKRITKSVIKHYISMDLLEFQKS